MATIDRRATMEELLQRKRIKRIEKARTSFWEYCKTRAPEFYKEDRWHLKEIAQTLQQLYEGTLLKPNGAPYENLIMNLPPRHGKSRTLILFCEWTLGKDQKNKIMTVSYNEDLATTFSRYTRDGISEEKINPEAIVFEDIFPEVRVKHGDGSYRQWALEGQFFNYKGAGLGGSLTGKGGNILIVDDPIKNAEEANNEHMLDKQWQFFTDTFLSRQEETERSIKIVNMTRWSKKDICGRLLASEEAADWYVLKMSVEDEQGQMLCPPLMSKKRLESLKKLMDEAILKANYFQEPIDIQGRLYKHIPTYSDAPPFDKIISYTDTADQGNDYLCSIAAGVHEGELYVLDVYYSKEGMETTEKATASMFYRNKVNRGLVESNSGGRGFARNVRRILWDDFQSKYTVVDWFHQSKNKEARILTNSSFIQTYVHMPADWKNRFPEFYEAISTYQKDGKNKNDDAPDALTGLAEMLHKETTRHTNPQQTYNAMKAFKF